MDIIILMKILPIVIIILIIFLADMKYKTTKVIKSFILPPLVISILLFGFFLLVVAQERGLYVAYLIFSFMAVVYWLIGGIVGIILSKTVQFLQKKNRNIEK